MLDGPVREGEEVIPDSVPRDAGREAALLMTLYPGLTLESIRDMEWPQYESLVSNFKEAAELHRPAGVL